MAESVKLYKLLQSNLREVFEMRGSIQVRVKREVEELVQVISRRTGFLPFTVRNTALLYGLMLITITGRIPESDREFLELMEKTKVILDE